MRLCVWCVWIPQRSFVRGYCTFPVFKRSSAFSLYIRNYKRNFREVNLCFWLIFLARIVWTIRFASPDIFTEARNSWLQQYTFSTAAFQFEKNIQGWTQAFILSLSVQNSCPHVWSPLLTLAKYSNAAAGGPSQHRFYIRSLLPSFALHMDVISCTITRKIEGEK